MRINTIINRYLIKEMMPPFVINLAFFMFIFMMTRVLEITNLIVNYHISLIDVGLMLVYSMPFFLQFIIPMSVMMAVLLAFLRMSDDNEVVALKSSGVSFFTFLPPVFIFCSMGLALSAFFGIWGLPWGTVSFNQKAIVVAESSIHAGLKERVFIDSFQDVVLYVNRIEKGTNELVDVFIEEKKTSGFVNTVVAPRGMLYNTPGEHVFHLQLHDGIINQADLENHTVRTIHFKRYEINLDLKQMVAKGANKKKSPEEMGLMELKKYIEGYGNRDARYYSALMKYYEKFSVPFACFALGLVAMPLGLQSRTEKRSYGVVIGLVLFLVYYILVSVGRSFGESGAYPPVIGMWAPNVMMCTIGVILFAAAVKDRSFSLSFIANGFKRIFPGKKGGA